MSIFNSLEAHQFKQHNWIVDDICQRNVHIYAFADLSHLERKLRTDPKTQDPSTIAYHRQWNLLFVLELGIQFKYLFSYANSKLVLAFKDRFEDIISQHEVNRLLLVLVLCQINISNITCIQLHVRFRICISIPVLIFHLDPESRCHIKVILLLSDLVSTFLKCQIKHRSFTHIVFLHTPQVRECWTKQ